ncbi:multicopper oxidase domain-containing protein [Bradyrhizobium sp. SRS-191]|uniref:multicopper oxidase domain-containing protein n=1 Tax=Bradyrhizobium sp. SRS-191 TaxID=2962606 RepID=UPI00211DCB3A|nr:multicopper oxidase domain-containing protein [Bradyrhizobium sp. SRS-191]
MTASSFVFFDKLLVGVIALGAVAVTASPVAAAVCDGHRIMHADVVAFDQPMMINRLGTSRPEGMIYALRRDVVMIDPSQDWVPGNVQLRSDKRPRPLVLRVNAGDCLKIDFQNLLARVPKSPQQPVTRTASIHVTGLEPATSINDDGFDAGANPDGQVGPGGRQTYTLYAPSEGTYLIYSPAGDFNGFSTTQQMAGLFGAVNVEPKSAEWYRSQVSNADMTLATSGNRNGQPLINYEARFRDGPRRGQPVLSMTDGDEIVASDLTALITGPRHGRFAKGSRPTQNPTLLPDREAPFREITSIYSESLDLVQAFPDYYTTPGTNLVVSGGGDGFAINYGASGIVNEILANRLKIGPSADCPECKFEEFFLSSWPGGDPGIVVDVPANLNCAGNWLSNIATSGAGASVGTVTVSDWGTSGCKNAETPRLKPTKAFYPDDPSNVYHSYLGDHTIFRVLHAGASVHHVHHHHAHQWLFAPDQPGSSYLDSQAIGPGSTFSMELVYFGAGNQNLTAGDSIFHCHFYPHFASGMWALFRVHDTLELGTELDGDGRPKPGSRALPDPEIATGTPTPAVVPLPTYAQAPVPAPVEIAGGQVHFAKKPDRNPGYPFFVPGLAGHRAPHPPLAFARDNHTVLDGGLPRHLVLGGQVKTEVHSQTDYTKNLDRIDALRLPEEGTVVEQLAMKAHEQRLHRGITPDGAPADFIETGAPRASGAPFANPTPPDQKDAPKRLYKGADVQIDTVFNKAGWHYPQQRMMALWSDVKSLIDGTKPPEPLFVRANNGETVEYWQSNLVPSYYELDDYQVRTPTDIIGQHIHLVKFDVLAADGAANGFNYEDGTFSPQEVRDRINAINQLGGMCEPLPGFVDIPAQCPAGALRRPKTAIPIPALGDGPGQEWKGAQATVRLWYVDPLKDLARERSYMTVFTHDHFSPSTHQEAGLYGGVLIEPKGSTWTMPDGAPLGQGRDDGGPTSFAANILPPDGSADKSYREFALAWADTQLVYGNTSKSRPDCYPTPPSAPGCVAPAKAYTGWTDTPNAINPAFNNIPTPPVVQPLVIADFGSGTFSMNYRNEPLPLRLNNAKTPEAGDAAWSYSSIDGRNAQFSVQPTGGSKINPACTDTSCFIFPKNPISAGMNYEDPYTPLLNVFPQDPVQIRLLSGGFTTMHDVITHGLPWKFEPYNPNSGWRESQLALLSEHFELHFTVPRAGDYLYATSASYEGMSNGLWGLLRASEKQAGLKLLPSNPKPVDLPFSPPDVAEKCDGGVPCLRVFAVTALTIEQALGKGAALTYNGRGLTLSTGFATNEVLNDPMAIIYVRNEDLCDQGSSDCVPGGMLKRGVTVEPLVLRVAAGDVVQVTLSNAVDTSAPTFTTSISGARPGVPYSTPYGGINLTPSTTVGLHPQLLAQDVTSSNGINVGDNPNSTASPMSNRTYRWYAGTLEAGPGGQPKATPVEFGALNLMPADPLNHPYRGLFGGLVVEPAGSSFVEDPTTHMSATIFLKDGSSFREFVVIGQDDADILLNGKSNYASGNALSAINYKTEPAVYRFGQLLQNFPNSIGPIQSWTNLTFNASPPPPGDIGTLAQVNWADVNTAPYIANRLVGGDPQTPVFRAPAGMASRFRLLHAGGNGDNQQVFELSGHSWQAEPYVNNSTGIGDNKTSPVVSVTSGYGATSHFDVVIPSSGGTGRVPGDYVYRSWTADQFQVGFWGLFRVAPTLGPVSDQFPDTIAITSAESDGGKFTVSGYVTVRPAKDEADRVHAKELRLRADGKTTAVQVGPDGRWSKTLDGAPNSVDLVSKFGGVAKWERSGDRAVVAKTMADIAAVRVLGAQPVAATMLQPPPPRVKIRNRRHVGLLK